MGVPVDIVLIIEDTGTTRARTEDSEKVPRGQWTLKSVAIDYLTPAGATGSRNGELFAKVNVLQSGTSFKRIWQKSGYLYPGHDLGWDVEIDLKETDVFSLEAWGRREELVAAVFRLVK